MSKQEVGAFLVEFIPEIIILAVFATVMALSLPVTASHIQPTADDEVHWVKPDTRSAKEFCLDNSNNMIQAWRCKYE